MEEQAETVTKAPFSWRHVRKDDAAIYYVLLSGVVPGDGMRRGMVSEMYRKGNEWWGRALSQDTDE